jgi:hypothetical protein
MTVKNGNGKATIAMWVGIIVPVAAVLFTIIGTIWNLASVAFRVAAQDTEIATIKVQREVDRQEIGRLRLETSAQKAALLEIETQFCEADHLRNLTHANDLRMFSMLWNKAFGQNLPTDNAYYPTVCNRKQSQ